MCTASTRIFLGCVAGALAILLFHQTTLQIFFWLGLSPNAAFRIAQVPPFNMPMVVSITFWGAVYGGVFGWLMPRRKGPLWLNGMGAGFLAMLLAWFVFLPLKGMPVAFSLHYAPMLRSFIAYQMWGLGLILLLPLVWPRRLHPGKRPWDAESLAA